MFNGSGLFVRLFSWIADRNANIKIRADRMDQEMDGFATGLSTCITKDGQTTVTAAIPFNNQRLTGVGDATAATDAVNRQTADKRATVRRNRWVNPALVVSQKNAGAVGTTNGYSPADQMFVTFSAAAAAFSTQNVASVTPGGSPSRVRVSVTTAKAVLAAGDIFAIAHPVEGIEAADFRWGAAAARQAIIRFMFRGPAGTYSVAARNGAANRSWLGSFTISGGEANTDTTQTIAIPGDTTGTWAVDNTAGLRLTVALACGTTFQGVAGWQAGNFIALNTQFNGLGSISNVFELGDCGLYLDKDSLGIAPDWGMPSYAEELAKCKRYWEKQGAIAGTVGNRNAMSWEVEKCASPTLTTTLAAGAGAVFAVNASAAAKGFYQSVANDVDSLCNVVGEVVL